MGGNFRARLVLATVVAIVATGVAGMGSAHASGLVFSVPSPNGLVDGQAVQIQFDSVVPDPNGLARAVVSECANGYADDSPLPGSSPNPARDCKVIAVIDISSSTSITTQVNVVQTGIGMGDRSCIVGGNFSCDLRVTQTTNQLSNTLPPPVPISFAANEPGSPRSTTLTVEDRGAPSALGKTAYAFVTVTTTGNYVVDGDVTIDLDGTPVTTTQLGADGTVSVPMGTPALGAHTIDAHYAGNGSFAAADASAPFNVIAATNISVADATIAEGDSPNGTVVVLPILLSQPPTSAVTLHWSMNTTGATNPASQGIDYRAPKYSGNILLLRGRSVAALRIKILGNTSDNPDKQLFVDLSTTTPGWDMRKSRGTITIVDDDPPSGPSAPVVSIGDESVPEGDSGVVHPVRVPLTLSQSQTQPVTVTVQLVPQNHAVHHTVKVKGDWGGPITQKFTFLPGQTHKNVSLSVFTDSVDEPSYRIAVNITSVVSTTGVTAGDASGVATIMSDE